MPPRRCALLRLESSSGCRERRPAAGGWTRSPLLRVGDEDEKGDFAATLQELALDDDNKAGIAAAGGLEVLVSLDGNEAQKEEAAGALRNLSANDDTVFQEGGEGGEEGRGGEQVR